MTGQRNPPRTAAVAVHAHASQHGRGAVCSATKRELMLGSSCSLAAALLSTAAPALAFTSPPPGFTRHLDRLDGYSFFYPESWQIVTTSGNDVFYRNPRIADENVFVDISSPSSSRYTSVAQLGSPEQASDRVIRQLKKESMSTRLGVQREFETLSATERTGAPLSRSYRSVPKVLVSASGRSLPRSVLVPEYAPLAASIQREVQANRVVSTGLTAKTELLYSAHGSRLEMKEQARQAVGAAGLQTLHELANAQHKSVAASPTDAKSGLYHRPTAHAFMQLTMGSCTTTSCRGSSLTPRASSWQSRMRSGRTQWCWSLTACSSTRSAPQTCASTSCGYRRPTAGTPRQGCRTRK